MECKTNAGHFMNQSIVIRKAIKEDEVRIKEWFLKILQAIYPNKNIIYLFLQNIAAMELEEH